jgi:hypothetical protein
MNTVDRQSEQVIRFSSLKLLLLFVPLALLVALSVYINPESWETAPAWVYWVFGVLGLFLVFGCIVMPWRYYLRMAPDGLTIQYPMTQRHNSWDEVRNFRVGGGPSVRGMSTGRRIVFDLAEDSPQRTALVKMAAVVNGYDVSVLALFGIGAGDLAGLLNEWQQRHGPGKSDVH